MSAAAAPSVVCACATQLPVSCRRGDRHSAGPPPSDDSPAGVPQPPAGSTSHSLHTLTSVVTGVVVAFAGGAPPAAQAARQEVDLDDGHGSALVYEFAVPLRVVALRGSVPTAWVPLFRKTQSRHARLHFSVRQQLASLYSELRAPGGTSKASDGSAARADAVTLGDAWLGPAIVEGLIAPIPKADASAWLARLPRGWHHLLRRCPASGQPSDRGSIFGVPYRWGCTLVALRDDVPEAAGVTDWCHLWDPRLRSRVGCTSTSREVLAIVLRSLGASPNTPDCSRLPPGVTQHHVTDRLRVFLKEQVRTLDDTHMLKSLACKDIWAAVGSSQEVLAFALRTPNIRVIAPASGTQLWADVWTLPVGRAHDPSPLLQQWYEFTTSPARANPGHGVKSGASPLMIAPACPPLPHREAVHRAAVHRATDDARLSCSLTDTSLPRPNVLARSEFLLPLTPAGRAQFGHMLDSCAKA